jgi:electron transport complex protein RnfE
MKTTTKQFISDTMTQSLTNNNPVFILMLSIAPVLALTNDLSLSIIAGINVLVILVVAFLIKRGLLSKVPEQLNIIVNILLVATLVSISELVLQVYDLAMYDAIGIYLPLTAVSGMILTQTNSKALDKDTFKNALIKVATQGISFLVTVILIAIIRSILTTGAVRLFGLQMRVFDVAYSFTLIDSPFGAFLILSLLMALFRNLTNRGAKS